MNDLNALTLFAKVVEANSFSEAARRLQMPISTVSRRVADLEDQVGARLLERSTRNLRLTELGSELLDHAVRCAEVSAAVDEIVSDRQAVVSGTIRLSAPPSISDCLVAPLATAFQASYPGVRIQMLVSGGEVSHIADGVDLMFRMGELKDCALVARPLLSYRHLLVASPAYLESCKAPRNPAELAQHRLLAFSQWKSEHTWSFCAAEGERTESVTFEPHLSMNDFAALASALLLGGGIGDLPPYVQLDLVRDGRLVEVMPEWRFSPINVYLVHLGNRHMAKAVRLFKEFAVQRAPALYPDLPQ
jgi:DNA-binding transcriptional LysR family regulator